MSVLEQCLELHSTKQKFSPRKCDIHRHGLYLIIKEYIHCIYKYTITVQQKIQIVSQFMP